jgi:serine/threonine-protein kinase RsbT
MGFTGKSLMLVMVTVTELARNIIDHAGEGEITLRAEFAPGCAGITVVAEDAGPGISNVHVAMRSGSSTTGQPGLGLCILRAMDSFTIDSRNGGAGSGTLITATRWHSAVSSS